MEATKFRLSIDGVRSVVGGLGQVQDGFKRVGDRVGEVTHSISGLTAIGGTLSIGAFAGLIKSAIDTADGLNDLSDTTGISVEKLSGLGYAAKLSGTDLDGLAKTINKLSVNIGKDAEKFAKLGVTAKEPIEAFKQFADVFASIEDPQLRAALGAEALGKSWESAAPALVQGGAKLGELIDKGQRLSGITRETTEQAGRFNDKLDEMKAIAGGLSMTLAGEMLPTLISILGEMEDGIRIAGGFGNALMTFGFSSPLGTPAEQITKYREELDDLDKSLERYRRSGSDTRAIEEARLKTLQQLQMAQARQRREVDYSSANQTDAESLRLGLRSRPTVSRSKIKGFIRDDDAAAKAANKELKEREKLLAKVLGINADYMTQLKGIQSLREKGTLTETEYVDAVKALIAEQPKAAKEIVEYAKAFPDATKATLEASEAHVKFIEKLTDGVVKLKEDTVAQAEYNQRIGLSKVAIAELDAVKLEDQATTLDGIAIKKLDKDLDEQRYSLYKAQADELRKLAGLKRTGAMKETIADVAKEQADEYKRTFDNLERSLTDAIMRGGKNALDYIKDYARTLVLRPIVQAVVNPIASALTGQGSSGSLLSMFGSGSNLLSVGKTLWDGFSSGGFSGMASSIGSMFGFGGAGMGLTGAASIGGSTSLASMGLAGGGMGAPIASSAAGAAGGGMMSGLGGMLSKIPVWGWILAGMLKNASLFDQGWDAQNGSMSAFGKFGFSSAPFFTDKILRGIGIKDKTAAILSGSSLISRAFGRKNPEMTSFGFQGDFADEGFVGGQNFARWKAKGGWFRSDREGTEYSDIKPELLETLTDSYKALKSVSTDFAKTLGLSADAIVGYRKAVIQDLTGDDTKDAEILAGIFSEISEDLATKLLPNFEEFAKRGETASTVLQRLATEYQAVDAVMTAIGRTFGAVELASSAARTRLVDLTGGLEALAAGADFFAREFLSEAERLAPIQKAVTAEMTRLGYAGVTTHRQFKDVVQGLDLTAENGAATYAALMRVQGAFDTVADAAIVSAQASEAKAKVDADAAADAAAAAVSVLQDRAMGVVNAAYATLQRSVDAQRDVVTKAYNETIGQIQARIDGVNVSISKLSSLSSTLRSTVDRMRMPSQFGVDRAAAQAQIIAALALARAGGVLPTGESLASALELVSQPSEQLFTTFQEYQRDFLITKNNIKDLADITDVQLSVEEKTLQALQLQQTTVEQGYQAELERLDGILASAQQTIDKLNGIDATGKTIAAALAGLTGSVHAAQAVGVGSAGAGPGAAMVNGLPNTTADTAVSTLYQVLTGKIGSKVDDEGRAYWTGKLAAGQPFEQVYREFETSANIVKARSFAVGTNFVTSDMPANIHYGERIMPAADNRELMERLRSPADGSAALAAEVRQLRAQVAKLLTVTDKTAANIKRSTDILDGVVRAELSFSTEVAA